MLTYLVARGNEEEEGAQKGFVRLELERIP